jgi:hypothetical protein
VKGDGELISTICGEMLLEHRGKIVVF